MRRQWRGCARRARGSSAPPTWSSSPSAASGWNPLLAPPKNPTTRKRGAVPAAPLSAPRGAQAEGMCGRALGSDPRGSIRQPAALCGVAGFKPTARRVPREGAFPLSFTLDSIGPLANSAACCAMYDAILAGEPPLPLPEMPAKGLRLLLPRSSALEDLDPQVGRAFDVALARLSRAGMLVIEHPVPAFDRQAEYFKGGGLAGAEAYHIHRPYLGRLAEYDPRVGKRVLLGKDISGPDYVLITELRAAYIR